MKILVIATLKGGVGKTSVAYNLGGMLGEKNKILFIDIDPQTNLSLNVGVDVTSKNLKTIKNVFDGYINADKLIFKNPMACLPNIDIIPSSILLTKTELDIINQPARENILKNFILDNQELLNKYDYIIIDTNPSMSILNQNAFLIADSIILVSDVSLNSIQGAELFIALWENTRKKLRKPDNIKALIINNFDRRLKLSNELIRYCKEQDFIKDILLNQVIYSSVKFKETELQNKTINILFKNSIYHEAYKNIINELKERNIIWVLTDLKRV